MKDYKTSPIFEKNIRKLNKQEFTNVFNKITKICSNNLNHYKNLKHSLKQYKRVHVNDSYVILFFGDDGTVYFVDYAHHDDIYKQSKKSLKKYKNLVFD